MLLSVTRSSLHSTMWNGNTHIRYDSVNAFCFSASGHLHCQINNGGCWKDTRGGKTYSACVVSSSDPVHCRN